jgi:predicted nucleic acid-binding Zn ribbon protein
MGSGPPGPCPECAGELRRVYGRVGVRFSGWGFRRTDSLVSDERPRKDFRKLKEKAEEIAEG